MSHLDSADLAAALDTTPTERGARALAHSVECTQCGALLAQARDDDVAVGQLLHALDHAPSPVTMSDIIAASSQDPYAHHDRSARISRLPRRALQLATGAGIVGIAAAAAAAAVGPHGMQKLWTQLVGRSSPAHVDHQHVASKPRTTYPVPVPPNEALRGVTVAASDSVVVTFRSAQRAGVIRVTPSTGGDVRVEGNADGATYTVGSSSITVGNHLSDSASYNIDIPDPDSLTVVRIRIGTELVYSRTGDRVLVPSAASLDGSVVLPLRKNR